MEIDTSAAMEIDILENPFLNGSGLDIDPAINIISLSDIHGDIDALIISLRDCANVIQSLDNLPNELDNRRDPELVRLLNLDLRELDQHQYFDEHSNLNFRWIGGNTHVIIIGDILDPVRKKINRMTKKTSLLTATLHHSNTPPNPPNNPKKHDIHRNVNDLYFQAEIKILKFINRLNELANEHGGRVIKLIGNHEMICFDTNMEYIKNYGDIYTHDGNELMPYIDGTGTIQTLPRQTYFNLNNPGFKLFMNHGSGIFLRINNTLFVHGQIYNKKTDQFTDQFTYNLCNDFNKWINDPNILDHTTIFFKQFTDDPAYPSPPQLWGREYGDNGAIHKRIESKDKIFCLNVIEDIKNFFTGAENLPQYNPEDFRIVIGHCQQHLSTHEVKSNTTFDTIKQTYNTNELSYPSRTFYTTNAEIDNNRVFGISMECPIDGIDGINKHHRIYKVDVGVSRGFDKDDNKFETKDTEIKKLYLSRVPQILKFQGDDVKIIRSTVQNSRIHQYRNVLETGVGKRILNYGGYKEKYMKYKKKYIDLKTKLSK